MTSHLRMRVKMKVYRLLNSDFNLSLRQHIKIEIKYIQQIII